MRSLGTGFPPYLIHNVCMLDRKKQSSCGYGDVFFPSQQRKERFGPWLQLHVQFLMSEWIPKLQRIGLTQDQSMRLWRKWCLPVGSIFKETDVDEAEFFKRLQTFADSMISGKAHLHELKWYLHASDWESVVVAIETASDPELTFHMQSGKEHRITIDSGNPPDDALDHVSKTLYKIYLPYVETLDEETPLRVEFPVKGLETAISPIVVMDHISRVAQRKLGKALKNAA